MSFSLGAMARIIGSVRTMAAMGGPKFGFNLGSKDLEVLWIFMNPFEAT
jgi:hypothetical protein